MHISDGDISDNNDEDNDVCMSVRARECVYVFVGTFFENFVATRIEFGCDYG